MFFLEAAGAIHFDSPVPRSDCSRRPVPCTGVIIRFVEWRSTLLRPDAIPDRGPSLHAESQTSHSLTSDFHPLVSGNIVLLRKSES